MPNIDRSGVKRSVTFVCLSAYPLFCQVDSDRIGGMETRAASFAKGLAKTGSWKPVFMLADCGQDRVESNHGVDLVIYRPILKSIQDNVVPRFGKYRWRIVVHLDKRDLHLAWHLPSYGLFRLLPKCLFNRFWKKLAPDVVCCFGNNSTSAEVIADCHRAGFKTVLCIASDEDLSADFTAGNRDLDRFGTPKWMAWYAITTADVVMVQTERQVDLLRQNFDRPSALVRNPVPVKESDRESWKPGNERDYVLWVGRSESFNKRPLMVLDLARMCPEISFLLIVNRKDETVSKRLFDERPENVAILEHVPHAQIWDYFRNARVFINTSLFEGFPNTFLQAAVSGAAVASLCVDPESVLSKKGCGLCAHGDFHQFITDVQRLWSDNELARGYAETFYEYAAANHRLEKQVAAFEALLERVVSAPEKRPLGCWTRSLSRFVGKPESVGD
jgi:glycosyltransferase involved in cell wall biosynthesis